MAAKRYRLLARAEMFGALRDPGFEFTLAEGQKGPMRTVVASDHGSNHEGNPGELREMPLYAEVVDPVQPEKLDDDSQPALIGDEV